MKFPAEMHFPRWPRPLLNMCILVNINTELTNLQNSCVNEIKKIKNKNAKKAFCPVVLNVYILRQRRKYKNL